MFYSRVALAINVPYFSSLFQDGINSHTKCGQFKDMHTRQQRARLIKTGLGDYDNDVNVPSFDELNKFCRILIKLEFPSVRAVSSVTLFPVMFNGLLFI